MITGDKYRITVLTDRLIRLEYSEEGKFEDRKSFTVVNRSFPETQVSINEEGENLSVETSELKLTYDKKVFSSIGLRIEVKKSGSVWNYGQAHDDFSNLLGTARTLDEADGAVHLQKGIFGKTGYAILDDSKTPIFDEGEFVSRQGEQIDIYFFGYDMDYYGGLKDFYTLCGRTPMIPRYALGNWWSRYYRYSEESYNAVLENFRKEGIPLSVAVIDMDWHVTDVDPKYGSGWTGYSWNKELFPNYRRFLKGLHNNKLAVTLNLHPADGIRAFEDMYEDVAKEMGIDPQTEEPVEFDFANPVFRKAYFEKVMHPYEADGVDFWWIDWQQGTGKKPGDVDPLNLLNHYHYEDQRGRNVRPMIFSRYAGPGSHRYPIGFSGDTKVTWRSLAYQPYFTSTASNIGYGWWSHDIGGHMLGDKDLDRLIRWIQYGVFSPIMRIHSSNSPFFNKEPWTLPQPYRDIMKKFMRLRHALVPYLYTETYRASTQGRPLIRPMYYDYFENPESYNVGNEYRFGENLVAMAITEPEDKKLRMACVRGIIPRGRWYDIFSGRIYEGERLRKFYRELSDIPVLIPAGGIVPLSMENTENGTDNPRSLWIVIGGGADGEYELYEDDGTSMDFEKGSCVKTKFGVKHDLEKCEITLSIGAAHGELSLIPDKRSFVVEILGVHIDGEKPGVENTGVGVKLEIPEESVKVSHEVVLEDVTLLENDYKKLVFEIIDRAWIDMIEKDRINDMLNSLERDDFYRWLESADISEKLKDAIEEVL